jgi:hypothetical protein
VSAVYQELETMRIAQYAVGLPCYICGEGNSRDEELCRHCHAPLALAHQAAVQKVTPQMLGVVGPAGCGKTVLLGMLLDLLSRQADDLQVLARGAFSISLQQSVVSHLARCEFPPKTPSEPDRWNWVHAQVKAPSRKGLELIVPDMSGESLVEEINHPNSCPVVRSFLEKTHGSLMLIDAGRLDQGDNEPDFFAMKVLSFLCELHGRSPQRKLDLPVAMVFTKADQCESAFEDATQFAQKQTPGLWQLCQQRLSKFRFFASGVVGACAFTYNRTGKQVVPLRIEPRGIVEPFRWLVSEMKPGRR